MTDREKLRAWVDAWRTAAPVLERQRDDDVRGVDTHAALAGLAECFELARREFEPRVDSGLVEQQRWFGKLRG